MKLERTVSMCNQDGYPDGNWIRQVVERYERPLLRYAALITGDPELGRDVVQDTFLKLCHQARDAVDGHLVQWLYTVCRNRALDVRRKENRMSTVSPQNAAKQPGREPPQAAAAEHRDSVRRVLDVLADLPANQQEVVRLKFQGGLSYREISEVTQLSVTNVGYLLHTALERLRRQLGPDDPIGKN